MGKQNISAAAGLALIRVLTGWVLFTSGLSWLGGAGLDGAVVQEHVRAALAESSGLFHWWGDTVLMANPDATALFWRSAALLFGLCFLLGALTRPAGFLASFFLWQGLLFGPESADLSLKLLLILCLGCAIGSAGRNFGLDRTLDKSWPGWLTWTAHRKGNDIFS